MTSADEKLSKGKAPAVELDESRTATVPAAEPANVAPTAPKRANSTDAPSAPPKRTRQAAVEDAEDSEEDAEDSEEDAAANTRSSDVDTVLDGSAEASECSSDAEIEDDEADGPEGGIYLLAAAKLGDQKDASVRALGCFVEMCVSISRQRFCYGRNAFSGDYAKELCILVLSGLVASQIEEVYIGRRLLAASNEGMDPHSSVSCLLLEELTHGHAVSRIHRLFYSLGWLVDASRRDLLSKDLAELARRQINAGPDMSPAEMHSRAVAFGRIFARSGTLAMAIPLAMCMDTLKKALRHDHQTLKCLSDFLAGPGDGDLQLGALSTKWAPLVRSARRLKEDFFTPLLCLLDRELKYTHIASFGQELWSLHDVARVIGVEVNEEFGREFEGDEVPSPSVESAMLHTIVDWDALELIDERKDTDLRPALWRTPEVPDHGHGPNGTVFRVRISPG